MLRIFAIDDSSVSGIGVARGDETVCATTARALARLTRRPVAWRSTGLSGATAKMAMDELVPFLTAEPADLVIVAFGVNDAMAYRSPAGFANDLAALVKAVRRQVGEAAVVIGGVATLAFFPGLPLPLRTILGWRCAALQAAAEQLSTRLPRLVVERFSARFVPELFACDGFHPNARAHALWGGGGRCTGAAVVARHGAILSTANAWEVIWARPGARDGQPIAPGRPYRRPRPWMKFVCRFLNTARLVGAVAKASDQVANA